MNDQNIAALHKCVEVNQSNIVVAREYYVGSRVVCDHCHARRGRSHCHTPPNATKPQNADGLAANRLDEGTRPSPRPGSPVAAENVLSKREPRSAP